jgi:sulfate/thiosulfate transport system substrate-binding protein
MRVISFSLVVALAAAGVAGAARRDATLNLVAYSTPKTVMGKIISAWNETGAGSGVSFNQSYGPSTDQARAVVNGLPADVIFLSTGDDMNLLADAGIVSRKWNRQSYNGIEADTVVVFALRDGNPKHVRGWPDLIKPGVQVVTPNPFSSGSAKWNVLAAYGAARRLGQSDRQATDFVTKLFQHVVSQDKSGRDATNTFLSGKGDVLLTYESEALAARAAGQNLQYVIPKQTMLIELPIAVAQKSSKLDKASSFVRFTKTEPAQALLGQYGFRPVNKRAAARFASTFPSRPTMFRIDNPLFGGWRRANKVWFDPSKGRMVQIERKIGGPTG